MPEYVVRQSALTIAALDPQDPYGHHEYTAGDVVELPDDERTAGLVDAGSIESKDDHEKNQVDPSSLPPSLDVAQGRGGEGDAPVLPVEDADRDGGKSKKNG